MSLNSMKTGSNLKWGIVGLGDTARKFASDLALVEGNILQTVASRSLQKADRFADQFKAEKGN